MDDNKLTIRENIHGLKLVAETYMEFERLAREQLKKEALPESDLKDVVIGLIVTKLLVAEGKLDEKYFKSAIS